jgi:hypothetical protein
MSTSLPTPEPTPEDVERAVADLESYLAEQAPAPSPAPVAEPVETRRVRELREEVAEAHQLLELQTDQAPLLVDTDRVRRTRKRAAQAAQLHALAQDPAARAWQAARWRLVLTITGMAALVLALGWSTANVHEFVAAGALAWSAVWVFGWLVEPFLSLALLTIVGARAYMGTRGQPLDHPTLRKIEWLFLGLTLLMNTWRYLPVVAERFNFAELVLHALGPIVAVAIVTALPIVWTAFADLDHGPLTAGATGAPTGREYRQNVPGTGSVSRGATDTRTAHLVTRARHLIATGQLPADPSATRLREALQCGTDAAREVRDALRTTQGGAA